MLPRCELPNQAIFNPASGVCALVGIGGAGKTAIAEQNGFHALTLDLLCGYVAAFCGGGPSRLPPLAEVKVPDETATEDPRLAAVKEHERKFGRLAQGCGAFVGARVAAEPLHFALPAVSSLWQNQCS